MGSSNLLQHGHTKVNDISSRTGFTTDKTSTYIRKLLEMDILEKETPVTDGVSSKRTFYKLSDNLFNFWYAFIFNNITALEFGESGKVLSKFVKPELENFVFSTFEDICKEFILINPTANLPFVPEQVGKLWGPEISSSNKVSLIAISESNAFFIDCVWGETPIDLEFLEELKQKASTYKNFSNKYYGIFSKSGFTSELKTYAKEHLYIYLYDLDNICS